MHTGGNDPGLRVAVSTACLAPLLAGRIHLGKMERSTQRLWASGVLEESLLVRNLGLAGSMVEELAGDED